MNQEFLRPESELFDAWSMEDWTRLAGKIAKRLRSPDDNDKLAALTYLVKAFPSAEEFAQSPQAAEIWTSLRATQFLERGLHGNESRPLIYTVLSVFCHVCPPPDLVPFVPLLARHLPESEAVFTEMASCLDDFSTVFEHIAILPETLPIIARALANPKKLSMTPPVFAARAKIFALLTGREDLSLRKLLFLVIAAITRANDALAIYKSQNVVHFEEFLAAERLALIELRLQLDVPPNYQELDAASRQHSADSQKFSQEIGSLLNPELSAASCELLELLLLPLVNHEEELNDSQIGSYFDTVNVMVHDCLEIIRAIKGKRDHDRMDVKCFLLVFGKWLMEGPFLCDNQEVIDALPVLCRALQFFPTEGLHFIPAFQTLVLKGKSHMKAANFHTLSDKLMVAANTEEKTVLENLKMEICKDACIDF